MWYTCDMRTRAQCTCGWQRELSEFYAGKRIRCPDCLSVVEVPGESSQGLYNSRLPSRPAGDGRWVPVRFGAARPRECTHVRCRGNGLFILVIAIVISVNALRLLQRDPWTHEMLEQRPVECTGPAAPCSAPREAATEPAKPAREYTPPTENEDEF